ncbi:MAG: 2-C-methyl-D-erythritol 4-phosphate cytidylyltransferase [Eubacteriales bacterium]|nr:2-C-methyl-D-erythritol 4-phosphate cytidylyltransferase [Eubacteriales bacterium]
MKAWLILLCGGSGSRMGAPVNKVLLPLRGVPALVRAAAPFTALCEGAVAAVRSEDEDDVRRTLARFGMGRFVRAFAPGGQTRQESVANALALVPPDAELVAVHDGARALVTEAVVRAALESAEAYGSGVAAIPVTDTIKRARADGTVTETLERSELYAMQTPQAFRTADLRRAHALAGGDIATDDAALLERAGLPVRLSAGSRENIKLTTPFDLTLGEAILAQREEEEQA